MFNWLKRSPKKTEPVERVATPDGTYQVAILAVKVYNGEGYLAGEVLDGRFKGALVFAHMPYSQFVVSKELFAELKAEQQQ